MLKTFTSVSPVAILIAFALPGQGHTQSSSPNLSGSYQCSPEPVQCQAPGYSVSQAGPTLELKSQDGTVAEGKLTSNVTVTAGPPWNSNGIIMPDRSIQWSNGTHWQKQ
jgi:hypothetical protein